MTLSTDQYQADPRKTGIIVVDHGSTRPESNQMLEDFVAMFRKHSHYSIIEAAHMELAEPSIQTAFDRCVEQGSTSVVVSPYFLSPGKHWAKDIPRLSAEAAAKHPGVHFMVAAPIGLHPMMAEVVQSRVDYCIEHAAGKQPECDVCAGTGRCVMKVHEAAEAR